MIGWRKLESGCRREGGGSVFRCNLGTGTTVPSCAGHSGHNWQGATGLGAGDWRGKELGRTIGVTRGLQGGREQSAES